MSQIFHLGFSFHFMPKIGKLFEKNININTVPSIIGLLAKAITPNLNSLYVISTELSKFKKMTAKNVICCILW